MSLADALTSILFTVGAAFFFAGTVGLLRFPDVYCRLHAVTKADNVGLGLVILGLALQAESWVIAGRLLMTWLLVLGASATVAHLIARASLKRGIAPWRAP